VLFETYLRTTKNLWIEEYLVDPPTHILNGFMWALWGAFDFWLARGDATAKGIFDRGVETLVRNLPRFDTGYWSLYEQSGTRLKMLASPFYHRLHIVQLRVMSRLTGDARFAAVAERWEELRAAPQQSDPRPGREKRLQIALLLMALNIHRENSLRLAILSARNGSARGARRGVVPALGADGA
jgi:hypothetical protein